ncbi:hypothetical protein L1049_012740 [Liquidambar formosana]|uniref:Uncharacterized protein n=1 Tax=Liquidambar formosana TaxID=63359 RepID=A0AAP0RLR0_LIQFO
MRKFDPWPIFFRREWNRNWPFLVGFAVTGALITKLTMGLTEEDAKNSAFVQRHKRYHHLSSNPRFRIHLRIEKKIIIIFFLLL